MFAEVEEKLVELKMASRKEREPNEGRRLVAESPYAAAAVAESTGDQNSAAERELFRLTQEVVKLKGTIESLQWSEIST